MNKQLYDKIMETIVASDLSEDVVVNTLIQLMADIVETPTMGPNVARQEWTEFEDARR